MNVYPFLRAVDVADLTFKPRYLPHFLSFRCYRFEHVRIYSTPCLPLLFDLTLSSLSPFRVPNESLFQWHPVVEFPPFLGAAPANYTSPYLQWSLVLTNVTVRFSPFLSSSSGADPFAFLQMNGTAIALNSTIYPETRNETWALLDA